MDRVVVRPLKFTDLFALWRYRRNPDVSSWLAKQEYFKLIRKPVYKLMQIYRVIFAIFFRQRKNFLKYTIELEDTHQPIGLITLTYSKTKEGEADLGFWLGKEFWGKGLMSEALKQFLLLAVEDLKIKKITAWAYDANTSSIRLLKKMGFNLVKESPNYFSIDNKKYAKLEFELDIRNYKR